MKTKRYKYELIDNVLVKRTTIVNGLLRSATFNLKKFIALRKRGHERNEAINVACVNVQIKSL